MRVFTLEQCANLIAAIESEPLEHVKGSHRDSFRTIAHSLAFGEQIAPTLGIRPATIGKDWFLYRYNTGGFFQAHRDGPDRGSTHSILIYLNADYTGGETVFHPSGKRVRRQAGHALIFPHDRLHSGAPVLSGRKYLMRGNLKLIGHHAKLFDVQD